MNLRNTFNLFILLSIIFYGFSSCSDSKDDDEPITYAQVRDVAIKQTINGQESFDLTEKDAPLTFSTSLTFENKPINWSKPTLEQTFNNILDISKENVTVTNAANTKVESIEIAVDGNNVKVIFQKVNGSYSYITSSTFKINVSTTIKAQISDEELNNLSYNGFTNQSMFYGESIGGNVKSNIVTIYPKLGGGVDYDVKGDPRNSEYAYKLNIVYFVAKDIQANPNYKERISTMLLKHQLFVCKWMKYWGYEEKSFGLPLAPNGMVDIVTVPAKGPKADYPYDGGSSKIAQEIREYYEANKLPYHSDHMFIISATNETTDDTPFYGTGKWAYGLDYPGMAFEAMERNPITFEPMAPKSDASHKATVWIGGNLHEMGHGLNKPHVGPTYTQYVTKNSEFGITLMGAGNRHYGENPTFMHESSAAIINNCQVSSFTKKVFYGSTTSSVKITNVEINGDKCTVKGSFTSSSKVTDVIVRFMDANNDAGYWSVASVAKPVNNTFEKTFDISDLKMNDQNEYVIWVTILMENGNNKIFKLDNVYKLVQSGGSYTLETNAISKFDWTMTASHALPKDEGISNSLTSLIDGDLATCLSLVKPNKTYEGVSVPATDQVYIIIDMKKGIEFNQVLLNFRQDQPSENLRAKEVSFYGSNDGKTFEPIKTSNELDVTKNTVTVDLGNKVNYRYLKMTYDKWHDSGSTMQFAELGLKNI